MGYIGNAPYQGVITSGNIVDGSIETADLKNSAVTVDKLAGSLDLSAKTVTLPAGVGGHASGTEANRPASPAIGTIYFNTDADTLQQYKSTGWEDVGTTPPAIAGITGTIYNSVATNLTISGSGFGVGATVRFSYGGSTSDVSVAPSSDTEITVTVPSAVYGQSAGTSITVTVIANGQTSNGSSKTVIAVPTGGSVYTSGGYRYHKFVSSGNFVVPSGLSVTADYLIVAGGGGGGGGYQGGGGGAGGVLSASSVSVSSGTYQVIVGLGGAGAAGGGGNAAAGGANSSVQFSGTPTAVGGGRGGAQDVSLPSGTQNCTSGGSGGGGNHNSGIPGASGTSGQGSAGGSGFDSPPHCGGGGGGAGGAGGNAPSDRGGVGGVGTNAYSTWASATSSGVSGYFAGGGAGSARGSIGVSGGAGGGGSYPANSQTGESGVAYSGGGGAAGRGADYNGSNFGVGGSGGSGIVIVRYQLS